MDSDKKNFLINRRNGIGGSDSAAIMGLSKWKTPLQVYLEKKGELEEIQENPSMRWGNILEPVILQEYSEQTGREVRKTKHQLKHKDYPFLIANLDGFVSEGRGVEVKTARNSDGWGEIGTQEIPIEYFIQVQHYLCVTNLPVWDVAVLIGGSDFRIYEIFPDEEIQNEIILHANKFWKRVVLNDPPPPTSYQDIKIKYKFSDSCEISADSLLKESINKLKFVRNKIKELEDEDEKIKVFILDQMKGAEILKNEDSILATWKLDKGRKIFDSDLLKKHHPDIYYKYTKQTTPARRFLVK